ncbi:MAG: EscU/YscU/HrcU family type III secretion system export apparatus switch protein [Pseudomonadota bacterium]
MSGGGGGAEDSAEKSHDPTPKRLEDARRKGDVPRSTDASAAAAYLGLLLALAAAGTGAVHEAGAALTVFLARPDTLAGHVLGPGGPAIAAGISVDVFIGLLPILLLPGAAVILTVLAQRAFTVAPEKLTPRLSRISPLENAKNKYGLTGLVEFAKTATKMTAVTVAVALFAIEEAEAVLGTTRAPALMIPAEMMRLGIALLSVVAAIAIVIAGIDIAWQRFDHMKRLRMSFQELRDETKEMEGDPHMKGKRRQRAEEIATNRMLADVPKADVVIVNPTHYAVALRWSRAPGTAPECVAKGVDDIAAAIREAAETARVPIHRDPPTARALHAAVEIGAEVPPDHYRAVAAAFRFAEALRKRAMGDGWRSEAP